MSKKITIKIKEYIKLLLSDFELNLLREAALDNWQGIDEVDYQLIVNFQKEKMKELGFKRRGV